MEQSTGDNAPLRIALVGAGPAAFYTLQHLRQQRGREIHVDMFDALPTPFGLVRHGVAPDHEKIKSVAAVYHKLALEPRFRFFGNVAFGSDVRRADLGRLYHQIVLCTGAQADRRLGIPGEDLAGSHSATEFVAWYNGHPDFARLEFDLKCRRAIVIGVGNVAVDVARILCRTPDELARTDIADYSIDALRGSGVREVDLVGRRGPLQAAFSTPEVKELGELGDATACTHADEVTLDELSRRALEGADKESRRKVEILAGMADHRDHAKSRRLNLRFLLSPIEILGDESGRVRAVRFVRNELHAGPDGDLRARATDRTEQIEAGLVFRSVGYRGVALPDLPFDERAAVVPNDAGRMLESPGGAPLVGFYASGWIKRGPTGVIGTNKPDAAETVRSMMEDAGAGRMLRPEATAEDAIVRLLDERRVRWIGYPDWIALDKLEVERGRALGRPRVKFTSREAMLAALARG
jgi:ferredoxin--NADP+ reductase